MIAIILRFPHASRHGPEDARKDLLVDDAMSGLLRVCASWGCIGCKTGATGCKRCLVVPPTKGLKTSEALLDAVLDGHSAGLQVV